MAIIPNAAGVERRNFSGQQGVVQMDTSNADMGLESFGSDLAEVSRDLKKTELVERQATMDKADVAMEISNSQIRAEAEKDPDWSTVEERSGVRIQESISTAAEGLDPRDREKWLNNQKLRGLESSERIRKGAWVKQRDTERAELDEDTAGMRNAALNSDDPGAVTAQYERYTETLAARGIIDQEEATNMNQAFKRDASLDRLDRMETDELGSALEDTDLRNNLPPDDVLRLEKRYEAEKLDEKAMGNADSYSEMSAQEAFDATSDIEDPKERLATEQRLRQVKADERAVQNETRAETHTELYLEMYPTDGSPGVNSTDLDKEKLESLSKSQIADLQALDTLIAEAKRLTFPSE